MKDDAPRQILLTPGPLTTSDATRHAMLRDWGSRDQAFIAMTARVRARLTQLAGGADSHICVPVQGSGTFAVEATLGTLIPPGGKALICINGAYGKRIAKICTVIGRAHEIYETAEDTPPDAARIATLLADDSGITHVVVVHCETTSGILNPIADIAEVTAAADRRLIVDAMSSFGALPLDVGALKAEAVIASANKCLEGAPGLGYAIIEKSALTAAAGNAPSLSLDLHDQHVYMERTGQWRFTPPTHVLAALDAALDQHEAEGGVAARGARYADNCRVLIDGLRALGFETFLPDALQAPIIVTVRMPGDPAFDFQRLYNRLAEQGVVLYPGAVTQEKSFRIGCIGQVFEADMRRALTAIEAALSEMGVHKDGLKPSV
ncbi:MAG: 2-aminoethylphosphonate--pyruvate transaminase [Alphaproteobacteria bacterium]